MVEHPEILERVTKEINEVIGRDRLPRLSDRVAMPYTEATLTEVNRYGVVAPVGLPKSVTSDTTFRKYSTFSISKSHFNPFKVCSFSSITKRAPNKNLITIQQIELFV